MPMVCSFEELRLQTRGAQAHHDITAEVVEVVEGSGIAMGLVVLHSMHTTAGLLVNECETGLRADMADLADRLVPSAHSYRHDDMSVRWENLCPEDLEAPNGHSHLQNAIFGSPSVTLPVNTGRLVLGKWQRVLLVEYDRPRPRRVFIQVLGTAENGVEDAWQAEAHEPEASHPAT
jgi:secondary thiamine-phosphate synthase enzyme